MTTMDNTELYSPGDLIREELEARGWLQQDLADMMGKSHVLVSEVVNGKRSITDETAAALAEAFGTSETLWLNLDHQYRKARRGAEEPDKRSTRATLYSRVPMRAIIKRGWVLESKDVFAMRDRALAFVEQESLDGEWEFDHAARKSSAYGITTPEQMAWLCRARQLARILTVQTTWKPNRIEDLVAEIQRLTMHEAALRSVSQVLSDFGVRLVVVERLPGLKMCGATFWLSSNEPVIALSLLHNRIDNVWHTIMHELGHVANKDRLAVDEQVLRSESERPDSEIKADEFAVGRLVPQDRLDDFCRRVGPMYSYVRIKGFAKLQKVHPGIVAGQLHHRGVEHRFFRKLLVPVRQYVTETAITDGWGNTVPI